MNFGEVIQNWKEGINWIDGRINPYVVRDMTGAFMNPAVSGEMLVRFSIVDRTFLVDGTVVEYHKDMEYHTFSLNGTEEEKEREANRLQCELNNFTNEAIAERQNQINELREKGLIVFTTNPYGW